MKNKTAETKDKGIVNGKKSNSRRYEEKIKPF